MIGGKQNDCFCPECRQPKNHDDMTQIVIGGKKKEVCKGCYYRFTQGAKRGTHV